MIVVKSAYLFLEKASSHEGCERINSVTEVVER